MVRNHLVIFRFSNQLLQTSLQARGVIVQWNLLQDGLHTIIGRLVSSSSVQRDLAWEPEGSSVQVPDGTKCGVWTGLLEVPVNQLLRCP